MAWLVTGGAGYIGAHVVRALQEAELGVVVIDDLSSGHREFVPAEVPFVEASVLDGTTLDELFAEHDIEGVIHLAGYKYAGESVKRPLHTYAQNVTGTAVLLAAMERAQVSRIVFSSSAGVYGTPRDERVTEATPTTPESPYGESKLIGEWLLADQARATELVHTSLRYFNVVGSEVPELPDTSPYNLFPLVFRALKEGRAPKIFGDDYPTPDGTAVRDYVHVADLARSHVAAARRMRAGEPLEPVYNLGSGEGSSVRQIMDAMVRGTGVDFTPEIAPRRRGDPALIVADGQLAARDLDWAMRHTLDDMVASAWAAAR
ncbi:UDP-glucose 4-epimerase GalE [Gryllotalpicola reticulitermitis]|uniref:UDP-glucose 4-epimerase n=1 Tax=Gryllotalpicola reticulitermitis TaxID=1184153 RepID=A0ABV8Q490_9MICO